MRLFRAQVTIGVAVLALLIQQGLFLFDITKTRAPDETPPAVFMDVSRQSGLGNNRAPAMEMAIGQAWGDYDHDDQVDLYVTDFNGPNTLYHNNGDGTFSLSELNEQVALPSAYSSGASFVDYDNDGWRDLFVANWGTDNLFRNDEGRRFVDVTGQAGINDPGNSKTASWGDYDEDGFLDLYLANWNCYPDCGRPNEGDPDKLYHNNGNGTFSDVSMLLGSQIRGSGFVASFTDFDNDGDLDIYLVNDEFINPIGNKLWRNDGSGCDGWCFKEVSRDAGAAFTVFGMGLATGDYDNDGDLDYYFSNAGPMVLMQNQGDGSFVDVAAEAGVQNRTSIGWGSIFLDYDNDGWRDLYQTVSGTTNGKDIASNFLFHNKGDGTFIPVSCNNELTDVHGSMGVAYADYNRDGWVDFVVGNMDEGYRLYRNQTNLTSMNRWLAVELVGAGPVNRDAVGARVILSTQDGNTQTQELINGASVGAGNELALYFGLGQFEHADITILWPDGQEQKFSKVAANQRYRLSYPLEGDTSLQRLAAPDTGGRFEIDLALWDLPGRPMLAAGMVLAILLAGFAFARVSPAATITARSAWIILGVITGRFGSHTHDSASNRGHPKGPGQNPGRAIGFVDGASRCPISHPERAAG